MAKRDIKNMTHTDFSQLVYDLTWRADGEQMDAINLMLQVRGVERAEKE